MGSVVGPLNPSIGFHGAGPLRDGSLIRRVRIFRASESSSRARFAPRQ